MEEGATVHTPSGKLRTASNSSHNVLSQHTPNITSKSVTIVRSFDNFNGDDISSQCELSIAGEIELEKQVAAPAFFWRKIERHYFSFA